MLRKPIAKLSGGMRRRVSIAMALLQHPKILVMDEASVGLDDVYWQALLCWLEDFLSKGGLLIWCTHRWEELDRLCGRCLRLESGKSCWVIPKQGNL